jgi:TPR repeat protein
VLIDLLEAVKLFEKAVAAGDIDAQYDMGVAFLRGCEEPAQLTGVLARNPSPTNRFTTPAHVPDHTTHAMTYHTR